MPLSKAATNVCKGSHVPMSVVGKPITTMRLNRTWQVDCPPASKAMVSGTLVPTLKGTFSVGGRLLRPKIKRRRLAMEIHGPVVTPDGSSNSARDEDGDKDKITTNRRGMMKRETETMSQAIQLSKELMDDDRIVIRILKPRKVWGFSRDPEDSTDSESDDDENKKKRRQDDDQKEASGWVEYRKYGVDEILDEELMGRNKNIFQATMGLGANKERREIHFENDEQANQFWTELKQLKVLVKERAQFRLQAFQETKRLTDERIRWASQLLMDTHKSFMDLTAQSEIQLLIEIVSATDLPIADYMKQSTDPYVIVYLGHEEIHRTSHIPNTLNPIWTIDTGCLCLLSMSAQEFFQPAAGLTFALKDHDALTANEMMGSVSVPQSTLLQLTGEERLALPLNLLKAHKYYHKPKPSGRHKASGGKVVFPPTLYIRARPATKEDRRFMKKVSDVQKRKSLGVYASETFVGPQRERVKLLKRESKVVDGVRKYRTKPHPDPARPEQETKWMSNEDLLSETMKPTHKWIEAGTGSLGKLYLEVLKCEGLPNLDAKVDGKTDAFCCIIYEDAIVNTDVINDTLKPRWMPWCQRGFLFRMTHPSSQILIGVFDYDSETSVAFNSHDTVGRISIDITNFRRDTEYVLTYDLYRSVLQNERTAFGTLTVRVRLEYDSYRDFVKGSLDLPPLNYINLPQKAAFKTSYFVVHGEENLDRFDMDHITAYRTELEQYLIVLHYMRRAAITILLWRGHKEVTIGKYKILLPLHSTVAFFMGITFIDNFNLAPSYFLFSIAWLLLATNEMRQRHPSPWHETLTYMQLWHAVLANKAPPVVIDAHENEAAIREYEKERKENQEKEVARAREAQERAAKIEALFSEERNSAAEAFLEDIATKLRGVPSLNILALALLPIQRRLGRLCRYLRVVSSIVLWNESIYSFIIVNACVFIGVVLIWIPWSFVIRWTLRIAIWVFLGPWMKLFDIYYVQKQIAGGENEEVMFQKLVEERLQTYTMARDALLRAKEELIKTRAMKRFMFGRFVTKVPRLKEYRYPDVPRAESYAKPVHSPPPVVIERRSHGQTLVGDLIPTWGDAVDAMKLAQKKKAKEAAQKVEEESAAKETKTRNMLADTEPEREPRLVDENESKQDSSTDAVDLAAREMP